MGDPRIVRSNAPEVAILNAKPTVTGQDKAKELAAVAKKNGGKMPPSSDSDWAKWITATGGGLLGYSLASSFLDDKTYEEKRKESVWSKVLRELASIGVGAAGAYGGYLLGKKAATNDVNAVSAPAREGHNDPLWDPIGKNWVLREDATGDGPYVDLFGEKRDAASAWKWPWAGFAAGSLVGGGVSAVHGARRTGEWLRGGAPKQVVGKDGVVENRVLPENSPKILEMKGNVRDINNALNDDAAKNKIYAEETARIKQENAQALANYEAKKKQLNDQFASDMDAYVNDEIPRYNERKKAWENSKGKKGPMSKAPAMPKKPTFKNFVPKDNPLPPILSGHTAADLATARSNLRKALGRRAAGGWGGAIASFLASWLMGRQALNNYNEEARVDAELSARGIDPKTVDLSN